MFLFLKVEEGVPAKKCRWPLEAGTDKGIDSPQEAPEETHPAKTLILAH